MVPAEMQGTTAGNSVTPARAKPAASIRSGGPKKIKGYWATALAPYSNASRFAAMYLGGTHSAMA